MFQIYLFTLVPELPQGNSKQMNSIIYQSRLKIQASRQFCEIKASSHVKFFLHNSFSNEQIKKASQILFCPLTYEGCALQMVYCNPHF